MTSDPNLLMRAWCPVNPSSRFERGYDVIFGEEDNPAFSTDALPGLMKVSYHYQVGKIGMDSQAGWVATVDGCAGDVFVQRFVFEPGEDYPDGSSVEFWHNGPGRIWAYNKWLEMPADPAKNPYVFESEVLSPFARLDPGEDYTWSYDWFACRIGGDFPVVDCNDVGVVSERLSVRVDGGRARLRGRLGVFHRGRLVLEAADDKAKVLGRKILKATVSPLGAIVLDEAIDLPPGTRRVAVVLEDDRGQRVGPVAAIAVPN